WVRYRAVGDCRLTEFAINIDSYIKIFTTDSGHCRFRHRLVAPIMCPHNSEARLTGRYPIVRDSEFYVFRIESHVFVAAHPQRRANFSIAAIIASEQAKRVRYRGEYRKDRHGADLCGKRILDRCIEPAIK